MERFKYYKRGQGELDTSNFPALLSGVTVDKLDEKTFMSLLALQSYHKSIFNQHTNINPFNIKVEVLGYVAHLRADKDLFNSAQLYEEYLPIMDFDIKNIQHESTSKIKSSKTSCFEIHIDLKPAGSTLYIGADKSVSKFCDVKVCADKIRTYGKVTALYLDLTGIDLTEYKSIVIVDDILGGGATIQMVIDALPLPLKVTKNLYLWTAYNEGIHRREFLDQFRGYNIGDLI